MKLKEGSEDGAQQVTNDLLRDLLKEVQALNRQIDCLNRNFIDRYKG